MKTVATVALFGLLLDREETDRILGLILLISLIVFLWMLTAFFLKSIWAIREFRLNLSVQRALLSANLLSLELTEGRDRRVDKTLKKTDATLHEIKTVASDLNSQAKVAAEAATVVRDKVTVLEQQQKTSDSHDRVLPKE